MNRLLRFLIKLSATASDDRVSYRDSSHFLVHVEIESNFEIVSTPSAVSRARNPDRDVRTATGALDRVDRIMDRAQYSDRAGPTDVRTNGRADGRTGTNGGSEVIGRIHHLR